MASWEVMRTKTRFNHPARRFFYKLLRKRFQNQHFDLMDVGICSMVDYDRLRSEFEELNLTYTGVDLHPDIVAKSKKYLKDPDKSFLWDLHDAAPEEVKTTKYDVVHVKHMIHYCNTYEVLDNLKPILHENGIIVIINNANIFGKASVREFEKRRYGVGKYGVGRYSSSFSKKGYYRYLNRSFKVEKKKLFKSKMVKPYYIDIVSLKETS